MAIALPAALCVLGLLLNKVFEKFFFGQVLLPLSPSVGVENVLAAGSLGALYFYAGALF